MNATSTFKFEFRGLAAMLAGVVLCVAVPTAARGDDHRHHYEFRDLFR